MVRLVLFGGKGGVGKTTMASATALDASRKGMRTLLVSSDPAHSTCDTFDQKIAERPTPIRGEPLLFAVEVDIRHKMEKVAAETAENTGDMGAWMLGLDNLEASELMLPGLDELMAFELMLKYIENNQYDLIIFDTAPTGHTLRFLSLPDLMSGWMERMDRMARNMGVLTALVPGTGAQFSEDRKKMNALQRRIGRVRKVLSDPKQTAFYIVLIPEYMAVEESRRAKQTLGTYSIPVQGCIINHVVPMKERCQECSGCVCADRSQLQQKYLQAIGSEFVGRTVATVPLMRKEVKGIRALEVVGGVLSPQLQLRLSKNLVGRMGLSPKIMAEIEQKPLYPAIHHTTNRGSET